MPSFNAVFLGMSSALHSSLRKAHYRKRPLEELPPLEIKTSAQSPDDIRDIQERTWGGFEPFPTLSLFLPTDPEKFKFAQHYFSYCLNENTLAKAERRNQSCRFSLTITLSSTITFIAVPPEISTHETIPFWESHCRSIYSPGVI